MFLEQFGLGPRYKACIIYSMEAFFSILNRNVLNSFNLQRKDNNIELQLVQGCVISLIFHNTDERYPDYLDSLRLNITLIHYVNYIHWTE